MHGLQITSHAQWRQASRSISDHAIDAVLTFGKCFWAGRGCFAYFLGRRTAVKARRKFRVSLEKFRGIAVIVGADGTLVTVQHRDKPPRHWKPA
ncbi:MAG: hypothetical protein IPK87_07785 [Planctomycetes bacterium]|nr:hypothetical protein [Planctomycetota bacterium]